jgi:hypothetical protein
MTHTKDEALKPAPVQPMAHIVGEIDHCGKVWKPVQPAPVQEPYGYVSTHTSGLMHFNKTFQGVYTDTATEIVAVYTTPPAAQRQWVGLSQDELDAMFSNTIKGKKLVNYVARAIEAKLKEKNAAAQPAVPDALTSADIQEHIEYVAGWNECRQAMLEMMK